MSWSGLGGKRGAATSCGGTRARVGCWRAQESGIETPTAEDLARLDRKRKGKKLSNQDWVSKSDPEAKIAKMKDGTTHLAYKPEQSAECVVLKALDDGPWKTRISEPKQKKWSNRLPGRDRFAVLAMNILAGLILLTAAAAPVNAVNGYFESRFVTPSHSPGGGLAARAAARAAMDAATLSPARASSVNVSAAAWKRPAR